MSARALRGLHVLLLVCIAVAGNATDLRAQGQRITRLDVAGFPLAVTSTLPTDFDAGFIALGLTTIAVDLTRNQGGGGFSPRVTTVNVRCATPCPASGTLPAGTLQWSRADLGAWNALTTTYALVESRTAAFNGDNDPWSNSIAWRYVLTWEGTPPAPDTQFFIQFELVVTAP